MRRRLILIVALAALIAVTFAGGVRLPVTQWLTTVVSYVRDAGAIGVVVFALAYVVSAVALLPGAALTLAAGFVYGPVLGTAIVSPVSVVAATCAFALGRSVARAWIARRVAGNERFTAIDDAVGRQGFRIVALLRLSPLFPFNVLNYALGLTRVRLRDFVLASWVGMLPGTALYVYLGSLITNVGDLAGNHQAGGSTAAAQFLYWGGLAATVAVVVLVTRTARRALARALDQQRQAARASTRQESI